MREIKFRVFYKEDNQMIDWNTLTQSAWNTFRGDEKVSLIYEVLVARKTEFEIMQYTGLKDKNGVEIYEGDIVKCPVSINKHFHGDYANRVVKWKKDSFTWVFDSPFSWGRFEDNLTGEGDYFEYTEEGTQLLIEVIGNIYENPELRKN